MALATFGADAECRPLSLPALHEADFRAGVPLAAPHLTGPASARRASRSTAGRTASAPARPLRSQVFVSSAGSFVTSAPRRGVPAVRSSPPGAWRGVLWGVRRRAIAAALFVPRTRI